MGQINDNVHFTQVSWNTCIPAQKSIPAYGLVHRFPVYSRQVGGSSVVDLTELAHIFAFAGKITGVQVVPIVAPDGGDRQFTVDVLLGNQGGAYATILTTPIVVSDSHANRQVLSGVLAVNPTVCSAGDSVQVVWDASGSTGTQGLGAVATIFVEEEPL